MSKTLDLVLAGFWANESEVMANVETPSLAHLYERVGPPFEISLLQYITYHILRKENASNSMFWALFMAPQKAGIMDGVVHQSSPRRRWFARGAWEKVVSVESASAQTNAGWAPGSGLGWATCPHRLNEEPILSIQAQLPHSFLMTKVRIRCLDNELPNPVRVNGAVSWFSPPYIWNHNCKLFDVRNQVSLRYSHLLSI